MNGRDGQDGLLHLPFQLNQIVEPLIRLLQIDAIDPGSQRGRYICTRELPIIQVILRSNG